MDHYKLLGVHKNSSKEEIKQAFRKLAMEFHPDKHSQSSKNLRDSSTQKFKELTEAYDTLIDDRKRADYNLKRNAYGPIRVNDMITGTVAVLIVTATLRVMGMVVPRPEAAAAMVFLPNLMWVLGFSPQGVFFSMPHFLGGMFIVDSGGKALWEMRNDGKSFEEAMESIEKAKAGKVKDSSY